MFGADLVSAWNGDLAPTRARSSSSGGDGAVLGLLAPGAYLSPKVLKNRPVAPMPLLYVFRRTARFA